MTFNPNADIRSDNVSRGGGGGGGRGRGLVLGGGGGGCLLLVIVVVYALVGGNPLDLLQGSDSVTSQGSQSGGSTECRTGADANESDDCLVQATVESADSAWNALAPGMDIDFQQPRASLFSGRTNTGCGAASSDVGPFYCPADATIYVDTSFYDDLASTYGASDGSFAKEYVIAHEYGHHIQNLQGTMDRIDHSQTGPRSDGVRLELQADCYAGVWGHHAASSTDAGGQEFLQPLTEEDIADGLSAASAVGDDHIQGEVSGGRVNPETWTHGSSTQRQKWFTTGYESGDPASCDTFSGADV